MLVKQTMHNGRLWVTMDECHKVTHSDYKRLVALHKANLNTTAMALVSVANKGGYRLATKFGFRKLRTIPIGTSLNDYQPMYLMQRDAPCLT